MYVAYIHVHIYVYIFFFLKFTGSKLIFKVNFFPLKLSLGKRFIGNFFQLTQLSQREQEYFQMLILQWASNKLYSPQKPDEKNIPA